jgi:hypothetical protein
MKELVSDSYFDSVQEQMVSKKFVLISRVSIDHTECSIRGRLPSSTKARVTSLFFHHTKPLIVQMTYTEYDAWDIDPSEQSGDVFGYWEVSIYARFWTYKELLDQNPQWLDDLDTDPGDSGLYGDMPILGTGDFKLEGFNHTTGLGLECSTRDVQVGLCFSETDSWRKENPTKAHILASRVAEGVKPLDKYLGKYPFFKISLSSFTPNHCFGENCERIFWSKFDWRYFRQLVVMPYGYNYRKRENASRVLV